MRPPFGREQAFFWYTLWFSKKINSVYTDRMSSV
jgi:hypothetical protein